MVTLPNDVNETIRILKDADYLTDRSLATALYLSISLKRPLFLEGEAGVGKQKSLKFSLKS